MLVDTHVHLYLDRFADDRDDVVARAREAGVETMLLPAIDAASVPAALALCDAYDDTHAMAAIHPSYVRDAGEGDLERIEAALSDPRVVAVGETGLDYYWDRSFDDLQHDMLRRHARLAMAHDLPLVLHSRDKQGRQEVYEDLLTILAEERTAHEHGDRLRGVFHCFVGDEALAWRVLDLGFHVGLGGVLTFKNGGLEGVARALPLDRIVLETDAPYLAPTPFRGKRNEPAYTRLVAVRLAELREMSLADVARATTQNARALFGLDVAV